MARGDHVRVKRRGYWHHGIDCGDGTVISNRPYVGHAWTNPGTYEVRLTGYNDSHRKGVSSTLTVEVVAQEVYYVNADNRTPAFPYMTGPRQSYRQNLMPIATSQYGKTSVDSLLDNFNFLFHPRISFENRSL